MFCEAFSQIPAIEAALKYKIFQIKPEVMALREIKRLSQNAFSGRKHPLETLWVSHALAVSPGAPLDLSPMWRDTKEKTVSPFRPLLVPKRQNYSIQEGPITVQQRFADPLGATSDKAFDDEGEIIIQGYRVN